MTEGQTVYVGARSPERGEAAAVELGANFVQLDVTDDVSVHNAMRVIDEREGRLDVLVNNAGTYDRIDGADGITAAGAFAQFDTNAVGVVRVTQAALRLLHKSENPVVVNVSSGLGSFAMVTDPDSHQFNVHSIVYSATKAAVDMLTVRYAQAVPDIKFNAVDPGRLATDLHGDYTAQSPTVGADVVARDATIGADGPHRHLPIHEQRAGLVTVDAGQRCTAGNRSSDDRGRLRRRSIHDRSEERAMSTTIQSTAATNGESTMSDEQIDEALQTFADGFAQSYRAPVLHTPAEEGLELHPEPPAGHRRGTPQCEYQCCSIVGQENRAGSWEVWCRGSRERAGGH